MTDSIAAPIRVSGLADHENRGMAQVKLGVTQSSTGMIPLGFGKFVRADEIVALVPIDGPQRGNGLRTYVHTDTLPEPLVASRSEKAILADMERALTASETPQRRRLFGRRLPPEQRRLQAA